MRPRPWRTFTLAPWRRAPLLLLRSPAVLVAVTAAAALLGLALASRPIFLASVGSAAVRSDSRDGCRYAVGLRVVAGHQFGTTTPDSADAAAIPRRTALLDGLRRTVGTGRLQPTVLTIQGGGAEVVSATGERGQGEVQLLSRTGFLDHVEQPTGPGGDGLWLPDTTASVLHVQPGDAVGLNLGRTTVPTRVAGTFKDLAYVDRSPFWCSVERQFTAFGSDTPPPAVLVDGPVLLRLLEAGGRTPVTTWWELPPSDQLSLPDAARMAKTMVAVSAQLRDDTPFSRVFGLDDGVFTHMTLDTNVDHARSVARQVRTTGDTVGAASAAIALVAVAGVGFFWVDRRRGEVQLLLSKGMGPAALGVKAALEALVPAVVGTAVGVVGAAVLVQAFGPSPVPDGEAIAHAIRIAGAGLGAALVLMAVAAGARAKRVERQLGTPPTRARATFVAGSLGLACVLGARAIDRGHSTSLGGRVVVFPLLVLVGGAGLVTTAGAWLLPRFRRRGDGWPIAGYLALRRLATAGPLALALAAGAVVSAGILGYSTVVATSARATVVAKATVGAGSDMVALLQNADVPPLPASVERRSTPVLRTVAAVDGDDHHQVDVLGVQARTFPRAAFFDRTFASTSLPSLLSGIGPAGRDGRVPVLVANGHDLPDRFTLGAVPVRVVGRARALPGMHDDTPLIVADEPALRAAGVTGSRELWVRGPTGPTQAALVQAHVPVLTVVEAKAGQAASTLLPLATSLGYFRSLGLLGGAVTLCAAVFYLASRERARRLASVMTRGMGLRRSSARRALFAELASLLGVGLAVGAGLSAWAARRTFGHLDPSPGHPPSPIFRWDLNALALAATITAVAAGVLAVLTERATARADPAEVARVDA